MRRALSPSTNPAGLMSAAGALYAAVVMILNAAHHTGVIDPKVIVAAVGAAAALYARLKVTPVADPRDGNGRPLEQAALEHRHPGGSARGTRARPRAQDATDERMIDRDAP